VVPMSYSLGSALSDLDTAQPRQSALRALVIMTMVEGGGIFQRSWAKHCDSCL
jgi:hypothetical protein